VVAALTCRRETSPRGRKRERERETKILLRSRKRGEWSSSLVSFLENGRSLLIRPEPAEADKTTVVSLRRRIRRGNNASGGTRGNKTSRQGDVPGIFSDPDQS